MWSANPVATAESGPETVTRDRSINMKASLRLARRGLYRLRIDLIMPTPLQRSPPPEPDLAHWSALSGSRHSGDWTNPLPRESCAPATAALGTISVLVWRRGSHWIVRRSRPIISEVRAKKLSCGSAAREVPDTGAPTRRAELAGVRDTRQPGGILRRASAGDCHQPNTFFAHRRGSAFGIPTGPPVRRVAKRKTLYVMPTSA
ncbi:MAG: hypothetical protein QOF70_2216 [Acetobacteraceae bacterium]|nr:hypothetical protein [Acetobacteraceae bacterium]